MISTRSALGLLAAAVALAAPTQAATAGVYSGVAKSANTGDFVSNACGYEEFSTQFVSAAESRFAYVSASFFEGGAVCGRCASVSLSPSKNPSHTTPNTTVTVMLISRFDDQCGTDQHSSDYDCTKDLLLSKQAYRDMLNQGSGSRYSVNWKYVECPCDFIEGGIEFEFGTATTPQLLTVQPRNFKGTIDSMEVEFEDGKRFAFGGVGENAYGSFRMVVLEDEAYNFAMPFTLIATQAETNSAIEVAITELPVPYEVLVTDEQF